MTSPSPSTSGRAAGVRTRFPRRSGLTPHALGQTVRALGRPSVDADGGPAAETGRRDLEIVVAVVVAMAALLDGPLVGLVAGLLLAAVALGTLQVLSAIDAPDADRGVPVESLIVPAVAAFGSIGAVRLLPLGPALVPAIVVVAVLLDRALSVETRIIRSPPGPTAEDRTASLIAILLVGLVAFTGAAAIVPGGIAGLEAPGAPVAPLALGNLAVLAVADAVIAGLLGYRAVALRVARARDAAWAAATSAAVIAIGAAAIRALGVPRLVGPALLMFLFYLWDTLHAAPPSRRRDPRWLWEMAILAGLAIAVVAWNLRLEA